MTHVSISVETGSRWENPEEGECGITHFIERALLRSTTNRLTSSLIRDMAKLGADLSTTASRENLMISATAPTQLKPVVGAMADIIKNAAYDHFDFESDRLHYANEIEARERDQHDVNMHEVLHKASFGASRLGQTMYMNQHDLNQLTPQKLQAWHKKYFVADRITIGAVGVDHDSFAALCEEMFGDVERQVEEIPNPQTCYHGDDIRLYSPDYEGPTHVAFAWNAPSMLSDQIVAAHVLQSCLGGGASFSSGGPGKGMYTRIYTNILGGVPGVQSADSFMTQYSDAGIFGVYAQVDAHHVMDYTQAILGEFINAGYSLTDSEVQRGKNMLKSNLYAHMSAASNRSDELARNIQLFDEFRFPKFMDQIDAITTADVREIALQIFNNNDPQITVATLGDVTQLPRKLVINHEDNSLVDFGDDDGAGHVDGDCVDDEGEDDFLVNEDFGELNADGGAKAGGEKVGA